MNTTLVFSKKMAAARTAKGWTQAQLAQRMGVSTQTVYNWETGHRSCRSTRLDDLSRILEKPREWFFQEEGLTIFDQSRMEMDSFRSEQVAQMRNHAGLTLEQLAEKMGVASIVVQRWESGHKRPSSAELNQIAHHCKVKFSNDTAPEALAKFAPVDFKKGLEQLDESIPVQMPRFWARKLTQFYQLMSKLHPNLEPLPGSLTQIEHAEPSNPVPSRLGLSLYGSMAPPLDSVCMDSYSSFPVPF